MSKRISYNRSSLSSWLIKQPKKSDKIPLTDSSVPTCDCNMTYTPAPLTVNTDTLESQTSNLENGKINTQLITSNLYDFTIDIKYFVKNSLSNLTKTLTIIKFNYYN